MPGDINQALCPTCQSERTALVMPDQADVFTFRCFACGRRWTTFEDTWPRPADRASDHPLRKRPRPAAGK